MVRAREGVFETYTEDRHETENHDHDHDGGNNGGTRTSTGTGTGTDSSSSSSSSTGTSSHDDDSNTTNGTELGIIDETRIDESMSVVVLNDIHLPAYASGEADLEAEHPANGNATDTVGQTTLRIGGATTTAMPLGNGASRRTSI